MNKPEPSRSHDSADDIDRLWQWFLHQDNLLATRVSVFLLAQSILIAVTASLINTVAGSSHDSRIPLLPEIFGLAIAINLAGPALTLVFWYVFKLNYENIGVVTDQLRSLDRLYVDTGHKEFERRNAHWYFRVLFRKKGMNWVIVNVLPVGALLIWCIIGAFSVAVFLSR